MHYHPCPMHMPHAHAPCTMRAHMPCAHRRVPCVRQVSGMSLSSMSHALSRGSRPARPCLQLTAHTSKAAAPSAFRTACASAAAASTSTAASASTSASASASAPASVNPLAANLVTCEVVLACWHLNYLAMTRFWRWWQIWSSAR